MVVTFSFVFWFEQHSLSSLKEEKSEEEGDTFSFVKTSLLPGEEDELEEKRPKFKVSHEKS